MVGTTKATGAGIRLDLVTLRYHRHAAPVLADVQLQLPQTGLICVRGANGSGKTTLLRVLAGVSRPTAGRVQGRPAKVGFVPERFPAGLRFTPESYLHHIGRIRGVAPSVLTDEIGSLIDTFGLGAFASVRLVELSKGTAQKVAAAQAFLGAPELVILDEAWTGLDAGAQPVLSGLARQRAGAGLVVFTDHRRRAGELVPDATFLVSGGAVTAAPEEPATVQASVRVEVADPAGTWEPLDEPGVTSVEHRGILVVVQVTPGGCDRLLAGALALGLSVHRVEPDPGGEVDP